MQGRAAPLLLVRARARRRPGRWWLPALGIALAAAFAAAVAAEGVVAGDQSARVALSGLPPLERSVRVTWQGPPTADAGRQARALLGSLGVVGASQVALMNPVRLSGVVVRPAAIAPLRAWVSVAEAARLGACRREDCPMLLAGGGPVAPTLRAIGVRIRVVGTTPLRSAVPLGFAPATDAAQPVLVTGDLTGLESLGGLSGVYRTHSWVAPLPVTRLHSWELAGAEGRLVRAQAALTTSASRFGLSAPFSGLDAARAQAGAAPRRLLPAGGGAIAVLILFIALAAGGLRRDQLAELERLRYAGARTGQCALFVAAEWGWLCALALGAGAGLGLAAGAVLAQSAGEPVGGVLTHSLLTLGGALALLGGWLVATMLVTLTVLAPSARLIDGLAVAATSGLVAALLAQPGPDGTLSLLLAPLCCIAAGIVIYRLAGGLLRAGERFSRRGPIAFRLALVGLARDPAFPALAVAFIAVSVGLGGFALAYRATLVRGAEDQAADQVPLDAVVSPSSDFTTPLALAPLARWNALAHGRVFAVRRTEAAFPTRDGTVAVAALGVPAAGLPLMHGWRARDGSAPLGALAARLRPGGPSRIPGPELPADGGSIGLRVVSPSLGVSVTADLRSPLGAVRRLELGTTAGHPGLLRGRLPPGRWELEAFELAEPTGLAATNGHQNGENPAAATQYSARVEVGPAVAQGPSGRTRLRLDLGAWRALGAASPAGHASSGSATVVGFAASGLIGVLRPAQPSDTRALPVLADPHTAGASDSGGRLALTLDGLPVTARVVGILRRFPTLAADVPGFVVADQTALAGTLDAGQPGQGRADELWAASPRLGPLRSALRSGPLAKLGSSFRADRYRAVRSAPIARGVLGTLIAAAGLAAMLGVLGLLAALLGGARDERIERDLEAQGMGRRALRAEARTRLILASGIGVALGLGVAVLLTRLAVVSVRSSLTVDTARPPLVTVVPWMALMAWGLGALAVLATATALASRRLIERGRAPRPFPRRAAATRGSLSEGAAR